jgi:hypothetical protein
MARCASRSRSRSASAPSRSTWTRSRYSAGWSLSSPHLGFTLSATQASSLRVGETIGGRAARQPVPVPPPISAQQSERRAGFVATLTATGRGHLGARRRAGFVATLTSTGRGRPGARTNLRPAARVGHHCSLAPGSCSLGSVLFEQPQLRGLLALAVSSYNLALPIRRGSSGSA